MSMTAVFLDRPRTPSLLFSPSVPWHPVDPETDHVLPARVVHGLAAPVLRVDERGDELLLEALLVLRADGDGRHERAVRHDRLLHAEAVHARQHRRLGHELLGAGPLHKLVLLQRGVWTARK